MKIFGYECNNDEVLELTEGTIECTIEELDKIIIFMQTTKEEFSKVDNYEGVCHSHYRDWDKEWCNSSSDLIILTKFAE